MRSHERAEDQTLLGVSMSKDLKERIRAAAEKEKRPMANWCAFHLERLLDEMDAASGEKHGFVNSQNPLASIQNRTSSRKAQ